VSWWRKSAAPEFALIVLLTAVPVTQAQDGSRAARSGSLPRSRRSGRRRRLLLYWLV
jgi:hypothetical protein